jgi:hypothetical protein
MVAKQQMTGMLGVYLAAAKLTNRGLVVSPTSRSAAGADLLVTDHKCQRAWSVQVKTNRKKAGFWLLNKDAGELKSPSHIYIFVNLRGDQRPEYLVVPSEVVASNMQTNEAPKGTWFQFNRRSAGTVGEGWSVFGVSD